MQVVVVVVVKPKSKLFWRRRGVTLYCHLLEVKFFAPFSHLMMQHDLAVVVFQQIVVVVVVVEK